MGGKIRTKLFFIFLFISIIPISVVTIISYNVYTNLVGKQVSLVATNTIDNSYEHINKVFQNINEITLTFQSYTTRPGNFTVAHEVKQLINNPNPDQYDFFSARSNMLFFFYNLVLGNEYIKGIYFFLPDGKSISYGIGTDLVNDYNPFKEEWYIQTLNKHGDLYISDSSIKDFTLDKERSIFFSRALYDVDNRQYLGVLMIDCDLAIFEDMDKEIFPSITNLYLVNEENNVLYSNHKEKIGQQSPQHLNAIAEDTLAEGVYEVSNNGNLLAIRHFLYNDWRIVASVELSKLYEQYGIKKQLLVYIALTCILIFSLLSVVLSNLITNPIVYLSKVMHKNKHLNLLRMEKNINRNDEIGVLYNEYNRMVNRIEEYIKERYQNKLITLDSQMRSLEAQINSHFLYNTLESIHSIAEIEEVESIATMTKALGDMFRYSIKTESELVLIEEELKHVKNYLYIQNIRFSDKIDFKYYIQDGLLKKRILKLILQPLIENALYHGLEGKNYHGKVTLNIYEAESQIIFEIIDDGVGISTKELDNLRILLNQQPSFNDLGRRAKRSIGLKNVHSRINLYYGSDYGLSIESTETKGTKIVINIPILK
nr:sensor histidine kinase [Bacillus solitudinis]